MTLIGHGMSAESQGLQRVKEQCVDCSCWLGSVLTMDGKLPRHTYAPYHVICVCVHVFKPTKENTIEFFQEIHLSNSYTVSEVLPHIVCFLIYSSLKSHITKCYFLLGQLGKVMVIVSVF